jgi:hypothetical protein
MNTYLRDGDKTKIIIGLNASPTYVSSSRRDISQTLGRPLRRCWPFDWFRATLQLSLRR